VTNDRSSPEFADYLLEVAARYPEADGVAAGDWLRNRFTVHYTPKHSSWLNQAEIAISLFSRQCLGQRLIGDRPSLRKETRAWNRRMNRDRVAIQWSFTRTLRISAALYRWEGPSWVAKCGKIQTKTICHASRNMEEPSPRAAVSRFGN
jgi:hypothetical protein